MIIDLDQNTELYHSLCIYIAELWLLPCFDSMHWASGKENLGTELFRVFKLLLFLSLQMLREVLMTSSALRCSFMELGWIYFQKVHVDSESVFTESRSSRSALFASTLLWCWGHHISYTSSCCASTDFRALNTWCVSVHDKPVPKSCTILWGAKITDSNERAICYAAIPQEWAENTF